MPLNVSAPGDDASRGDGELSSGDGSEGEDSGGACSHEAS